MDAQTQMTPHGSAGNLLDMQRQQQAAAAAGIPQPPQLHSSASTSPGSRTVAAPDERPKTRNPRYNSSHQLISPRNNDGTPTEGNTTPSHQGRDAEVAQVLWSESSVGLSPNQIVRPHTSNPVYSEKTTTPVRESPSSSVNPAPPAATESPAGVSANALTVSTSQSHPADQNGGVLWASDSQTIDPDMIARPRTSNPWLHRQRNPHTDAATSPINALSSVNPEEGKNGILWSSAEVRDWHLLARPHASNPELEHKAEKAEDRQASTNEPTPQATQVLDVSKEGTPDPHPPSSGAVTMTPEAAPVAEPAAASPAPSRVTEDLQHIVSSQARRIHSLEQEVMALRQRLVDVTGLPPEDLFPPPSVRNSPPQPQQHQSSQPQHHQQQPVVAPPHHSFVPDQATALEQNDSMRVDSVSNTPQSNRAASSSAQQVHAMQQRGSDVSPIAHEGTMEPPTPLSNTTIPTDDDVSKFVQEDAANDDTFDRGVAAAAATSAPRAGPSSSAVGAQPRYGAQRPVSAAASRSGVNAARSAIEAAYQTAARPYSAPSGRQAAVTSFVEQASALLVDNDNLTIEFARLCPGTSTLLPRETFKEYYRRRADEYGMIVTEPELNRMLRRFNAGGPDHLTFEEFSVLYLRIAAW